MLNSGIFSCDKKRCLTGIVLLLCSSFLWDLSFWSRETSWVISIAFVPVLIIVRKRLLNSFSSFLAGWLLGFIFFIFNLHWLKFIGVFPWILLALLQGLFIGLWMFIISFKYDKFYSNSWKQILIPPLAWIVIEWLRGQGRFGMEWGAPVYSQHANLFIVQWASVVGPYGVSGIIIFVNSLLSAIVLNNSGFKKTIIYCVTTIIFLVFIFFGGKHMLMSNKMGEIILRLALLQPNFSQKDKWDALNFERHIIKFRDMVSDAKKHGVDLIVFPETAIPDYLPVKEELLSIVSSWAKENTVDIAVGSIDFENGHEWNAVFFIGKEGKIRGRYRKQHLVPFGEYIPFPFRWLRGKVKVLDLVGEYKAGSESPVFVTNDELFWSSLICFESTMPELARRSVQHGAKMIAVSTNDAWFEDSKAPVMHAAMAVFRAVENRITVVQAANTGISTIIWPSGEVRNSSDLLSEAIIIGDVMVQDKVTIYTMFGDVIVLLSVLILLRVLFSRKSFG